MVLKSNGFIPEPTDLYNKKYGVIKMTNYGPCPDYCCGSENVFQCYSKPAEYNFVILKGSTLDFDIVYKDASKTPVNLTGYKARCIAQYDNKTFTITSTICDAESGKIHMYMSAYETSNIFTIDYKYTNKTEYTYQLELISPSKTVYRILEGIICVVPSAGGC